MEQIEIKNLSFAYTKKDQAIKDISMTIKKGEWVSIIGHNGSGKSTLSKLLIGLLQADKGEIYIDGQQLNEDSIYDIRKKIGIVFQNPDNQFVGVTVKHDIAFGLENLCVEREEMIKLVDEFSTKVGMNEYLEREPHLLSGGQKQRVAIAGILACNSDIIILDEATSMLDPEGVNSVVELFRELKDVYHKTMITITHDLDIASLSDRIIVLKEGQVVLEGQPSEVFKHEQLLKDAYLDIPFNLKLYNEVKNDQELSQNEGLVKALWEFSLTK